MLSLSLSGHHHVENAGEEPKNGLNKSSLFRNTRSKTPIHFSHKNIYSFMIRTTKAKKGGLIIYFLCLRSATLIISFFIHLIRLQWIVLQFHWFLVFPGRPRLHHRSTCSAFCHSPCSMFRHHLTCRLKSTLNKNC